MSTKKDKFSKKDILYMNLALKLARTRHGLTGENPSVGCLIVKNNKILSIGKTGYNGRPHAESNAIKNSNINLKGSKMYVTLEPCNHYGKTSPCTKKIIKSKIKEVIYAIDDVDKRVKGKSLSILKSKNILVKKGLLKKEISNFYVPYFINKKNKLPYVTGKIALSKNNLIYSKGTKRITNTHTDKMTHFLRYQNDSLLISYKTLNQDDPKLNCRIGGLNKYSPKRIVLDNFLKTKTTSFIFKTVKKNNTVIFYNEASKERILLFKKRNVKLIKIKLLKNKNFDIKLVLKKLYNIGCRNLLVEGGNQLTKSILIKRLFNQFYLIKSSKQLSKLVDHKEFKYFKELSQNYKNKVKIKTKLGKDVITLYKK